MEGALPSVVGGLIGVPLVAVPTSVGYGASFGGLAALLAMLNSCAPGVTVVNIDNGYGAGVFAARVARRTAQPRGRGDVTLWVDASAGASGDMLLGALVGAGVPVDVLQDAVDAVAPEPVALRVEPVTRNGFAATRCHVEVARLGTPPHLARHPGACCGRRPRRGRPRPGASRVFERLAVAEAAVHGSDPLDVVLPRGRRTRRDRRRGRRRAPGLPARLGEVVVSPVAVGSGTVRGRPRHAAGPAAGRGRAAARRAVVRRTGGSPRHGAVHPDRCRAADHRSRPAGDRSRR